ncbi:MAG: hypothetical protein GXP31_09875 [Kiritimatiellaeota bacterium]|nr:hypothetical protein [Kiritimatiellota bacterium]
MLAVVLCVLQALLTLYASHRQGIYVTSTQISVVSFVILVLLVVGVNPLLRILPWIKPLGRAELILVFATLAVTAGISTFGLADQLVPLIATPHNPKWATAQRGWDKDILPFLDDRLYLRDERQVVQFREGLDPSQSLWRDVPWRAWLGPLFNWFGFVAAGYGLFYFLTLVLYPQWAYREKLIFPLAKIPQELIPPGNRGRIPASFRTGVFWVGFLVPFCVQLWNGSIAAGWLHGVSPIPLVLDTGVLKDTAFNSLLGAFNLSVFFAAVGIAFLLPPAVSFSIWFYFLVYNAMVFAACSLGFGKTGADFPRDWIWTSNFLTAQGGGAIVAFGVICLYKALAGYREGARDLSPSERRRQLWPLVGLGASFLGMIWWMTAHLPAASRWQGLFWVFVFVTLLTVITVSLMRVVAECGIFGYQSWTGPFHFAKMLNLPRVIGAGVIAPLLTFYSILFLDIKTFIAPAFLNAEKMSDDAGSTRFRFHLTLWISILATVTASVVGSILLAYRVGAQQMSSWFYSQATPMLLDRARKLVEWQQAWSPGHVTSAVAGAAWVILSVFLRRTLFWFPHPVGYIMFVNPLIRAYWFSFFIAWLVKTMVLKYGGRHTFERVKPFFIGLIIGEIMACAVWAVLVWALGLSGVHIDLNRHA